jgi:hypothetical protein
MDPWVERQSIDGGSIRCHVGPSYAEGGPQQCTWKPSRPVSIQMFHGSSSRQLAFSLTGLGGRDPILLSDAHAESGTGVVMRKVFYEISWKFIT